MPGTSQPVDAGHRQAQPPSYTPLSTNPSPQTDDVGISGWIAAIPIPPSGLSLRDIEREALILTMRLTGHNQSAAARILRISRPTLARKLRGHGLKL